MIVQLTDYIEKTRPEFKALCLEHLAEYERAMPSHPGSQKGQNGLALHTVQVIEKALELNPGCDPQEIIETCLVHDLKHWKTFPLRPRQVMAIEATKGLPWKRWRRTPEHRFVALILVADMWSAYLNGRA